MLSSSAGLRQHGSPRAPLSVTGMPWVWSSSWTPSTPSPQAAHCGRGACCAAPFVPAPGPRGGLGRRVGRGRLGAATCEHGIAGCRTARADEGCPSPGQLGWLGFSQLRLGSSAGSAAVHAAPAAPRPCPGADASMCLSPGFITPLSSLTCMHLTAGGALARPRAPCAATGARRRGGCCH